MCTRIVIALFLLLLALLVAHLITLEYACEEPSRCGMLYAQRGLHCTTSVLCLLNVALFSYGHSALKARELRRLQNFFIVLVGALVVWIINDIVNGQILQAMSPLGWLVGATTAVRTISYLVLGGWYAFGVHHLAYQLDEAERFGRQQH